MQWQWHGSTAAATASSKIEKQSPAPAAGRYQSTKRSGTQLSLGWCSSKTLHTRLPPRITHYPFRSCQFLTLLHHATPYVPTSSNSPPSSSARLHPTPLFPIRLLVQSSSCKKQCCKHQTVLLQLRLLILMIIALPLPRQPPPPSPPPRLPPAHMQTSHRLEDNRSETWNAKHAT